MRDTKFKFVVFIAVLFLTIIGCSVSRSVRVDSLWEPPYKPNFDYSVSDNKNAFSGYTVGILEPEFIEQGVINQKKNVWTYRGQREKQFLSEFKRNVSNTFEKILLSKGIKIQGPFASYQEMTYPERERCTFLIKPTILIDIETQYTSGLNLLEDVGGPNLEPWAYASVQGKILGTAQMEYLILDPLTQEKLERHKLKTTELSQSFKIFAQGVYNQDGKPINFKTLSEWAENDPSSRNNYARYYNPDNASARILESLFQDFIPQVAKLISVEEFDHLKKYQEQLKGKKVY